MPCITASPEPVARRYIASPGNEPVAADFLGDQRSTAHPASAHAPPTPTARRYLESPRTEPVTAGFLRTAVAALRAQPAPIRHPPRLLIPPRPKSRRNVTCEFVCSFNGQQPYLRLIPASCRTKNKKTIKKDRNKRRRNRTGDTDKSQRQDINA